MKKPGQDTARIERLLGQLLDGSVDGVFAFDRAGRLTVWNSVMERRSGIPRAEALGKDIFEALPALNKGEDGGLLEVLDGRSFHVRGNSYSPILDEEGQIVGGLAILRAAPEPLMAHPRDSESHLKETLLAEIAQRAEVERRQGAHFAVTRVLAQARPLENISVELLRVVCEGLGWSLGELWLRPLGGRELRWEALWHIPGIDAQAFEKAGWSMRFNEGEDLPGRVLASGKAEWISDIEKDEGFLRSPAAARAGLRRACAVPVLGEGPSLGVLAFFAAESRSQDQDEMASLADIGRHLGLFLERRQIEEERDLLLRLSPGLLCAVDAGGRLCFVGPSCRDILGFSPQEVEGKPLLELAHPEDRSLVDAEMAKLGEGESATSFEARCLRKNGSCASFLWSACLSPGAKFAYVFLQPR